ncbi:hypothetical protein DXX93_14265 [Thalassotalea euphylliae]|uniref:Uncharacterized protein n=1 Tax=Thalassotalea euphylliae TaxID=1655234 RepID=A0A3E0TSI9_9GAMM|nr:hypothetical protein [Thalassotalea euphylliae]REL27606.1 hypothetical protein DXX93_14265 [Thalassotalea euphylliae]
MSKPIDKQINKLLEQHHKLIHSESLKVKSHVQRENGDWILNTLMLDNIDVPFKYKRKKLYRSLQGQRVNITYYPATEQVAGFEMEIMNIVRIKVA